MATRTLPTPAPDNNDTSTCRNGDTTAPATADQRHAEGLIARALQAHADAQAERHARKLQDEQRAREQAEHDRRQAVANAAEVAQWLLTSAAAGLDWQPVERHTAAAALAIPGVRLLHHTNHTYLVLGVTRCDQVDHERHYTVHDLAGLGALLAQHTSQPAESCDDCQQQAQWAAEAQREADREAEALAQAEAPRVPLPQRARTTAADQAATRAKSRAIDILGSEDAELLAWQGHPDATATGELDGLAFRYDLATDTLAVAIDDLGVIRWAPVGSLAELGRVLEADQAGWALAVCPDTAGPDSPLLTVWRHDRADRLTDLVRELIADLLDERGVA